MEVTCILQNFCVPCPQFFGCSHVIEHLRHPKARPLRIAFAIQSVAIGRNFSSPPNIVIINLVASRASCFAVNSPAFARLVSTTIRQTTPMPRGAASGRKWP